MRGNGSLCVDNDFGWAETSRKFVGMVALVENVMKIKIAGPGAMTKRGPRPHGSAVGTVNRYVRNVVTNAVSVVAEGKGRHAREHRVGAGMSGAPKALAE